MGTHIPVIPEVLVERLVQEPRKKEQKLMPGRVEKGTKRSWQRHFSFF